MADDEKPETPEERAERRRQTWKGGKVDGWAAAEQMDVDFWRAATPQERIRGLTELVDEFSLMPGQHESELRLQRTVGGARPRRS